MSLKSKSVLAPAFIVSVSLLPACASQSQVHRNPPAPDGTLSTNPPQPEPEPVDPEETPLLVPEPDDGSHPAARNPPPISPPDEEAP
ncbi:MAG: hypothetical protein KF915_17360 [Polyangiaceae bacterium]|nr:hypothetical protein [Polyangiaceae bacterium]